MTLDNRARNFPSAPSAKAAFPQPFVLSAIRKLARKNTDFRREIATMAHAQVTVMCIGAGDNIGEEVHDVDQLLLLVRGHGAFLLEGKRTSVAKGDMILVPAGTRHDLANQGGKRLQLVSIYAPPHHPRGTVHRTRADATAADAPPHPAPRRPGAGIAKQPPPSKGRGSAARRST